MKRMKAVMTGMLVAAAVFVFITGCSNQNPVAPTTDSNGNDHYSPGQEAILVQPEIDGDDIGNDTNTGRAFDKEQPGITEYDPEDQQETIPAEYVDDAEFLQIDKR